MSERVDPLQPPEELEVLIGYKYDRDRHWLSWRIDDDAKYMSGYDKVYKLKVPVPQELFEMKIEEALAAALGAEMEVELMVREKKQADSAATDESA